MWSRTQRGWSGSVRTASPDVTVTCPLAIDPDRIRHVAGKTKILCVAVSGGSDSLALLHLLREPSRSAGIKLHVLTVDHGLRPAAANEARAVAQHAETLRLPVSVLTISRNDFSSASPGQAALRRARYAILSHAARSLGAGAIAVGHTQDDQLETQVLRQRAGSGTWGLAGMDESAPVPVWPEGRGLTLFRPLLRTSRADLQRYLRGLGHDWISDPSNSDRRFERVRIRQDGVKGSLSSETALSLAKQRDDMRFVTAERLSRSLSWLPGNAARLTEIERDWFVGKQGFPILRLLLACVSGKETFPRPDQLVKALESLEQGHRVTLHGCLLQHEQSASTLLVSPETERLDCVPTSLSVSGETLWQGRTLIRSIHPSTPSLYVRARGDLSLPKDIMAAARSLPASVRASLPVIVDADGRIISVPHVCAQAAGQFVVSDLGQDRLSRFLAARSVFPTEL